MVFIVLSMGQFVGFRRTSASSFFVVVFFYKAKEVGGMTKDGCWNSKSKKLSYRERSYLHFNCYLYLNVVCVFAIKRQVVMRS